MATSRSLPASGRAPQGHGAATAVSQDAAAQGMEPVGDGAMWLTPRYRAALEQAGLADFEAFLVGHGGCCLRALDDRENWRIDAADPFPQRRVFLKKHHVRSWRSWLRARLGMGPGDTPGRVEARIARQLTASGIQVMELVAFGEKIRPSGLVESFVVTEDLQGYRVLDKFLAERFSRPQAGRRDRELHELIRRLAAVVGRFHGAGYNHRDLYCCHFFIREPSSGRFEIKLIDLQRVQFRRCFRWRWLIKDLAQLGWSAPCAQLSCTQKMAFLHAYLGVNKLRPAHKCLVRAVIAKQQIMQRRLGPPR